MFKVLPLIEDWDFSVCSCVLEVCLGYAREKMEHHISDGIIPYIYGQAATMGIKSCVQRLDSAVSYLRSRVFTQYLDLLYDHLPEFVLIFPYPAQKVSHIPEHSNSRETHIDIISLMGKRRYHLNQLF